MSEALCPAATALGAAMPIAFVDLETTGGSPDDHRITEVGIVEVADGRVTHWSTLVDPQQPIPPFIQQLTGISDAMVRGAPTFGALASDLFARLAGRLFIAHNANFDRGFLRAEFGRAGFAFNPDVLCTVRLSRALFPAYKRHGLDALVERHALVPSDRHRALADADLIWQFWQRLPGLVEPAVLSAQVERTMRRYQIAAGITDDLLDTAPAGHGVYAFYGDDDAPLYVGRSVRVRQRVRAHLTGERRSARELRIAQQVRRVAWQATGGEVGALLLEAQWLAALRPAFNRVARDTKVPAAAPWPFDGPVYFEERDAASGAYAVHVVDRWRYAGHTARADAAPSLAAAAAERPFEAATWRILQTHLARGLRVVPVAVSRAAGEDVQTGGARQPAAPDSFASATAPTPPAAQTCPSACASAADPS